ncbi:MAG TPA: extracellular solute-binding protein [Stellaceae bacterium]|nr:extracellular solute-binding protein [Stellaceae bacterium]
MTRGRFCALLVFGLLAFARVGVAADWQDGAGPDWQRVVAAAQKEGPVVVAGAGELAKPMKDAFTRDTGIAVEWLAAEPRDILPRIGREVRARSLTIDLFFTGASMLGMMHDGLMAPIKPQLLLPGVNDAANWNDGRIKWVDNEQQYFLIPCEYVFGWPLFNAEIVKHGQIATWKDMLRPEFKGKIAAYDPRSPGPGQAGAAYLADLYGIDFVKALYVGQDATLAANSRQLVEWVARGTYPIGLSTVPTDIESFRQNGFKTLDVGDMRDGPGTLLGGSSLVVEAKGVPHPNAATVFLNWYLSRPGQEIYSAVWGIPSRRADVHVPTVPAYTIPKPGAAYLDQYREDWYQNVRPKLQAEIIAALGGQ